MNEGTTQKHFNVIAWPERLMVKKHENREKVLPDHFLSLHPTDSAESQTAAGYRPHPLAARYGLDRAWCNPLGAQTLRGPPHIAGWEGSDLKAQ